MARKSSKPTKRSEQIEPGRLEFKPLRPSLIEDMGEVLRGSWGSGCWCIFPRLTPALESELPGPGSASDRRRAAMTKLARRRRAPGLLAFQDDEAVGWIAIAPRSELLRVDNSRTSPRVDDVAVWVIPCVTVSPKARGAGITVAMIRAAVEYAAEHGAPAVEAYPRAGDKRVKDNNAYFGTEPMFRRAGFRVIRKPPGNLPKNWVPRVTMRVTLE